MKKQMQFVHADGNREVCAERDFPNAESGRMTGTEFVQLVEWMDRELEKVRIPEGAFLEFVDEGGPEFI